MGHHQLLMERGAGFVWINANVALAEQQRSRTEAL